MVLLFRFSGSTARRKGFSCISLWWKDSSSSSTLIPRIKSCSGTFHFAWTIYSVTVLLTLSDIAFSFVNWLRRSSTSQSVISLIAAVPPCACISRINISHTFRNHWKITHGADGGRTVETCETNIIMQNVCLYDEDRGLFNLVLCTILHMF